MGSVATEATASIPAQSARQNFHNSDYVQIWIVIAAVIIGLFLFVVSRWGDEDLKAQLNKQRQIDEQDAQQLQDRSADAAPNNLNL
jgi:hypothetical protein